MDIRYTGSSQDMEFTLIDDKGDTLVQAWDVPSIQNGSLENSSVIHKRLELQGMGRGIYGIKVNGTTFPILYSVKIEAVKIQPEKSMLLFIPALVNGKNKTNN